MSVQWEDPPQRSGRGRSRKWSDILEPLTERPGCWAVVAEYPAGRYRDGSNQCMNFKRSRHWHEWEFRHTGSYATGSKLYARYIGPGEPS